MSQLNINIGQAANDKTGDTIRVAFSKVNANFTEVYGGLASLANVIAQEIPSQTGHAGTVLSTDGTHLVWSEISLNTLNNNNHSLVLNSDGTLTLPDGSTIGEGEWYSNNGVTLQNHDSDFSLQSGVSASASGQAAIHSQNDSGSIQLSVTTDSHNNIVTISNNSNNWTFGSDGSVTLPTNGSIDTYSGTGGFKITTDGQIQFASGYSIGGSDTGLGLRMATDRGTILFGNHPECMPTLLTHFHIMKQDASAVDLFLGDDNNYVKLPGNGETAYGVEIGTNVGSAYTWRFGTDGNLTVPGAVNHYVANTLTPFSINSWQDIQLTTGDGVNTGYQNWTFGTDGNLTIPAGGVISDSTDYLTTRNINIQGALKGVDGSTGSTGQVLTRQSNGGVAWADSTGGGGAPDGGLADNTAGITITTSTLATDLNNYDNSGSVTFNIRDAGASAAGIIFKGLTVNHTQTITSETYAQGDNTVTWSYLDYQLWEQMVSITAYATDSRGYTFYAVVNDAWDVPHGPCLVEGTQVTMADGTHKAIEDIQHGELVRVWNFDLGEFIEAQPIWIKAAEETTGHDVYTFSDGTKLRTVGHHVFNKQAGAFTKLKYDETPIGTTTFNEHGEEVTLLSKERVIEPTRYYNVWTQYHLNLFADGILTSNRFNNIYPIVDMKFVKDNRVLRDLEEFTGIDEKYITGLRLQEQSQEYTAEYISNYVHNRLERLDIANTAEQGI